VDAIPELVESVLAAVLKCLPQIIAALIKLTGALVLALPQILLSLTMAVVKIVVGLFDTICQTFMGLPSFFSDTFNTVVENIDTALADMGEYFVGLWEDVVEAFSGAESFFYGLGNNIVSWLQSGISSTWNELTKWFGGLFVSTFGTTFNGSINSSSFNGSAISTSVPVSNLRSGHIDMTYPKRGGVNIVQNIYSEAKTAADLMQEAVYQQEKGVLLGV
jgi:phage-related protein